MIEHLAEVALRLLLSVVLGFLATWTRDPSEEDIEVTRSATFLSFSGALMLCVVEDQLARAFGLMGAASVVRYRHRLRRADDASDLIIALSLGMACGAGLEALAFTAALVVRVVRLGWDLVRRLPGVDPRRAVFVEVRGAPDAGRLASAVFSAQGVHVSLLEVEARPADEQDARKWLNRWSWEARLPRGLDELGLADALLAAGVGTAKVVCRPAEGP